MSDAAVYPSARQSFLKGEIDLNTSTVKIQAVSASYVYSATHDFLNDVGAGTRLGTAVALTSKTFTDGEFNAASVTYYGVTAAAVIAGFVGYIDTGTESTSRLIWYCDISSDASDMAFIAPGGGILVKWPYGKIFTI